MSNDQNYVSDEEFLSLREVSNRLGITTKTLRDMIREGRGPIAVKAGRRWLKVRRGDLAAYINQRTLRPRESLEVTQAAAA